MKNKITINDKNDIKFMDGLYQEYDNDISDYDNELLNEKDKNIKYSKLQLFTE